MTKADMDIISAAALMVVSVVVFFASGSVVAKTNMAIGPDFFPRTIAVLLFICCAIMLGDAMRKRILAGPAEGRKRARSGSFVHDYADWLSIALIVVYALSFETLGYLVATTLYIFVQSLLLIEPGKKPPFLMIGLVAVVMAGVSYFLFARVFYPFLPVGLLG